MIINEVRKVIDPESNEIRFYFDGYITPEFIQDVAYNSFGLNFERLGREFVKEILNPIGDIE